MPSGNSLPVPFFDWKALYSERADVYRQIMHETAADGGFILQSAVAEFEASLKRAPRRLVGLYDAAHAAKLAGDSAKASRYFADLVEVTKASDGSRAEVKEARTATAQIARR